MHSLICEVLILTASEIYLQGEKDLGWNFLKPHRNPSVRIWVAPVSHPRKVWMTEPSERCPSIVVGDRQGESRPHVTRWLLHEKCKWRPWIAKCGGIWQLHNHWGGRMPHQQKTLQRAYLLQTKHVKTAGNPNYKPNFYGWYFPYSCICIRHLLRLPLKAGHKEVYKQL